MKRKILITAALMLCFGAAFAWFADVNGKWSTTLKTPDGNEFPLTYSLKSDGSTLTGTVDSPQGAIDLTEGKVKGDSLWFSVDAGGTKVLNAGKYIAAGDSISLGIDFQGMKFHTTLKRAADK
ncbi:MAG: glycoside hydrolase [Bacteroidetes bacterium]|nr:glycoside hydrolase [Bacteroidota bacterium]